MANTTRKPGDADPSDATDLTVAAVATPATDPTLAAKPAADDATSDTQIGALPPGSQPGRPVSPALGAVSDFAGFVPVDPSFYARGGEIARGGMGRIIAAHDRRLGRDVVIKELLIDSGDLRDRFEREARITARLQHPSIVSLLEAGTWPTGEPFYVMRRVKGETLDALIRGRKTLGERMALLPNLISVVEALAYAHDAGVIHRDLKPANVLVGAFGETVVIDWGLAKDLDVVDTSPAPSILATARGSVMGTPAFMPPEQARGDIVDQSADVYALAAMLYQLLTGLPPYAGNHDVLYAVIEGPPAPVEERVEGVPADLLTIVAKGMARDRAERYANAVELADDLRRFETGQLVGSHHYSTKERLIRWARRHRTAVRVSAVALLVFAVGSGWAVRRIFRERAETEAMRVLAERHRGEAEDLLGFMLEDLRDKLEPLGKLDVLDSVAKRALAYYSERGGDLSDADQRKQAMGLTNLGDVLAHRGDLPGALGVYEAALGTRQRLVSAAPTDVNLRNDVATSEVRIGEVLELKGDFDGAKAAFAKAAEIERSLAAAQPDSERPAKMLSRALSHGGELFLNRGDLDRAESLFAEEMKVIEPATRRWPKNNDLLGELAIAHENRGALLELKGDLPGALAAYRAFVSLEEPLAIAAPDDTARQRGLSIAYFKVADVQRSAGALDEALRSYTRSNELAERIANNDPSNADLVRDLVVGIERVGTVLERKGNLAGALVQYRRIVAMVEGLLKRSPDNVLWQRDLADSVMHLASVRAAQKDIDGALEENRRALSILERLRSKDPSNLDLRAGIADYTAELGKVFLAGKDLARAYAAEREAVDTLTSLTAKDADNIIFQNAFAKALAGLADVQRAQAKHVEAHETAMQALSVVELLLAKTPSDPALLKLAGQLKRALATRQPVDARARTPAR